MGKYNLGFISDTDLLEHVSNIVNMFRSQINLKDFNKNIIDPIKLTFDSKIYNKSIEDIIRAEILRQIDKSNNNQIGYFHQNIFNYIGGEDWYVPSKGFDIINKRVKTYVEMKNKHNTMNSSSSQKSYMNMQSQILQDAESTCLLVEIIAKQSQDIPWSISLNGNSRKDDRIRRVSIDKFYSMVTKDNQAFYKLCMALPVVLDEIVNNMNDTIIKDTVLSELKATYKNKDLLMSLFLMAFEKYEGFKKISS